MGVEMDGFFDDLFPGKSPIANNNG